MPTRDPAASPAAGNEAEQLVADGRVVDAVDLLVADQQTSAPPEDAIRLLDLRHEAARSFDTGPGRTPWPPTYDDPFPGVSGRLPEISATELTTEILGGAVAHHGALVVRQLFDGDRVARAVDAIRTAQRASDAATSAGGADPAWYRPFPTGNQQDVVLRNMVARQGGTWLADSPAATAHFLGQLASVGVIDAIARHFGERPFFSLQKSTMRRSRPEARLTAWHQDGSFLDADVRTMNVWIALTDCGGDHPAPGLEVVPKRIGEILPVDGILSPHSVPFELVDEVAADAPVIRPEFRAGDALLFDQLFLHRTYLDGSMTEDRYALECWFFAPSHPATSYTPFLV